LKKGDRVTAINGEPVPDAGAYAAAARALQPGDRVAVTAVRDGKPWTFEVEAGNVVPPRPPGARFGVVAAAGGDKEGVLVQSVREDSPAAAAGVKEGDRITAVNGKSVKDVRDFADLLRDVREEDKLELTVLRDGKKQKMTVVVK
jgi:serine protease Do